MLCKGQSELRCTFLISSYILINKISLVAHISSDNFSEASHDNYLSFIVQLVASSLLRHQEVETQRLSRAGSWFWIYNLLMDLFYTVLLMVLIRAEAQNVIDVTAELGQDVNLTCSINRADIYWSLEIHHQLKTLIGRTFSSARPTFSSPDFGTKFPVLLWEEDQWDDSLWRRLQADLSSSSHNDSGPQHQPRE